MYYLITVEPGYLRATMFDRETLEETREFVHAVIRENEKHRRSAILIDVRLSRSLFHVEPRGFFAYFRKLAGNSSCSVALLGDIDELNLSHEYLALLARQQGLNVVSFRDEATALKWLSARQRRPERRNRSERRQSAAEPPPSERRRPRERRLRSIFALPNPCPSCG